MSEQKRIFQKKRISRRKTETAADSLLDQDSENEAVQLSGAIDEVLAEFSAEEHPTEVIGKNGLKTRRSPVRNISSEQFVRSFRQTSGE